MKPLLQALARQETPHRPVWLMRQAGRYLPEYREVRATAGGFMQMCQNPQIACEITLQPIKRFPLDAAIIFSDILTIADALGLGLHFVEGEGPRLHKPVTSESDIVNLPAIDPAADLGYVGKAIEMVASELADHIALIGFAGSPWTVATYMLEGGSPKGHFARSKAMLYDRPALLHLLLDTLVEVTTDYLLMQIRAGAEVVQIFDTWGGVLSTSDYLEFSLGPMQRIVTRVQQAAPSVPIILFTKGGGQWLRQISESGCDAVGLDWTCDLHHARNQIGHRCALQGNLDPAVLRASPEVIESHTCAMLGRFGKKPGYIANLGHGITPDILPEQVGAFIRAVHAASSRQ